MLGPQLLPAMNAHEHWSRLLIVVGYLAMLLGALDPLEGSLAILPGGALVTLGTFLRPGERRWFAFRAWCLVAIAGGIGAMFGLSAFGGIGGTAGLSPGWSLLLLPYLFGWLMAVLGPGSPRWVRLAAILVGLWYMVLAMLLLTRCDARDMRARLLARSSAKAS
jgi:hypothetical protein